MMFVRLEHAWSCHGWASTGVELQRALEESCLLTTNKQENDWTEGNVSDLNEVACSLITNLLQYWQGLTTDHTICGNHRQGSIIPLCPTFTTHAAANAVSSIWLQCWCDYKQNKLKSNYSYFSMENTHSITSSFHGMIHGHVHWLNSTLI